MLRNETSCKPVSFDSWEYLDTRCAAHCLTPVCLAQGTGTGAKYVQPGLPVTWRTASSLPAALIFLSLAHTEQAAWCCAYCEALF